ncbi:MAG TPA: amino acid ABC transporter permease [Candidatus Atribacteria bacterium]|nr:MAG: amino acid ABC transporter permease [Candidatus Nealsonbacteria bacterium]HDK26016.1 amino acid ABC transporter permease [Candidatus Atribacteria bacterium]
MELISGVNLKNLMFMLKTGLIVTIYLSIIAITIGTLIGSIIGWLRTIANEFFDSIILIFVDIIRSTPLIIQLLIAYHLPGFLGINISTILAGSIVIVLYFAANCSQVVKAGIDSVTFNQWRAAESLGFSYFQQMRYIILPQAWRAMIPSYTGFALGIIKDTSLISVIGVIELVRSGQIIISRTLNPLPIWFVIGLIYFIICWPLSKMSRNLEKKTQFGEK